MMPANDTAPATLTLGQIFESKTWRVQRKGDHVKVLEVRSAGARGKRAALFIVREDLDAAVAPACAGAAAALSVEEMRALLPADTFETVVPTFEIERVRDRVRVESATVRADFGARDFRITFVATHTRPNGASFTIDTTVHQASVADARKALAWAREHAATLAGLGHYEACAVLRSAGIRAA